MWAVWCLCGRSSEQGLSSAVISVRDKFFAVSAVISVQDKHFAVSKAASLHELYSVDWGVKA